MNRVKMITTQQGSDDGLTVRSFIAGREYEITDNMLAAFISVGAVEIVEDKAVHASVLENKPVKGRRRK